jgi:hypothetical protein
MILSCMFYLVCIVNHVIILLNVSYSVLWYQLKCKIKWTSAMLILAAFCNKMSPSIKFQQLNKLHTVYGFLCVLRVHSNI